MREPSSETMTEVSNLTKNRQERGRTTNSTHLHHQHKIPSKKYHTIFREFRYQGSCAALIALSLYTIPNWRLIFSIGCFAILWFCFDALWTKRSWEICHLEDLLLLLIIHTHIYLYLYQRQWFKLLRKSIHLYPRKIALSQRYLFMIFYLCKLFCKVRLCLRKLSKENIKL